MKLIVRKTGTIFDFCESSDGIEYDGIIYGGSSVKLSYTNDTLSVVVDGGEAKKYDLTDLNYDDLSEIIGFASMLEFIENLKTAGFTGNFNQGGATPQEKELILYVSQSGTDAPIFTIKENTSDIANVDITSDIIVGLPNVLIPRIILGTEPIFYSDIKEISFTSIRERFEVENQTIQSASIREFIDNAISFNSTIQYVLNNTLKNQGGILEGFLTIKFI